MRTEHITFISKCDGLELEGLIIAPENPKAVLQLAHGMCEHKERYIPFMEYMAEQGFACVIHDHRGHGKSVKSISDLGYFYENGAEAIIEDTYQVLKEIKERYQGLPYILMGHSMGSMVVRCFIKKYDSEIDALIVCGSPSANDMVDFGIGLVFLLKKCKGGYGKSRLMDYIVTGNCDKVFAKERLKSSWITSDRKVVEAYNADPYCNYKFTLNGYEALLLLMKNTYSKKGWMMSKNTLPIHFIAGADDPYITNAGKFESAVQFLRDRGYKNATSKLYEGMRHEVLNEKNKAIVYKDVVEFCEGIIGP